MSIYYQDEHVTLLHGDALEVARELPDGAVDCVVTSPPYFGLRDYGTEGQYGLEESPQAYVETMRGLFSELRRVLADDGTLWLNIGDSYSTRGGNMSSGATGRDYRSTYADLRTRAPGSNGLPDKNMLGIPWRVAFALQDDGWILRNAIIWHKPNAMPESVTDRLSCRYEHVFLFSKSPRYWFDLDPIRAELAYPECADGKRVFGGTNKGLQGGIGASERRRGKNAWKPAKTTSSSTPGTLWIAQDGPPVMGADGLPQMVSGTQAPALDGNESSNGNGLKGRNPGDVWTIPTSPFPGAHFAVFPVALPQRCILAGCKPGGTVLDPFNGSGTTGLAAQRTGRKYVGIDLNAEYLELSLRTRLRQSALDFGEGA